MSSKARLARIPSNERREAWLRIARRPYTDDEKRDALGRLLMLVTRMESMLAEDGGWLVGDAYSLADVAAVPFIARIDEIAPHALSFETHPRVHDWWAAVRKRPAFAVARFDRFDETLRARGAVDRG